MLLFMKNNPIIRLSVLLVFLAGLHTALAQPTIIATVPVNAATGVSPGAAVVFTFSTAMNPDPDVTLAQFYDFAVGFTPLPVISVWSAGNTVLTCTPSPAFANNHSITWIVTGQDALGNDLGGIPGGTFKTGSGGGGGGGSGTNAVTSFVLNKIGEYNQTSMAFPSLDADYPYFFSALTSLASNRTATAVTLTFPNSAVSNLTQNSLEPEDYYSYDISITNLAVFNSTYPAGNYTFKVSSNAVSQSVTVNLPFPPPNAPYIRNYAAAQTINPTQPFTLTWDEFRGGTSADYIFVSIDDDADTIFETAPFGSTNALKGTATSVVIPANTLQAGSNYDATVGFFLGLVTTNSADGYVAEGYVATITKFRISTAGSGASAPVLTNATWSAGAFGFDIITSPGQMLTVVSSTNLNTASTTWPVLLITNSPETKVHISDPRSVTNRTLFYRVRNGN
jgi:hypothetical protein